MSSIDQRVVQMLFDNAAFEKGVATTLASLEKLNSSLKLQGATKGLDDVDAAASKGLNLGNLANGVDQIASKFSSLGVIGVAALANITNRVIDAGVEIAKNFVIDPIKDGFNNYETQINAVQTILANTGLTGAAGLQKVNDVLAQLNTYANQTVYNFSDMAKNIGTFTAAGVDLNTSVSSIKGIANLAALSGSTAEQASTAMYQLSQAIAAGSVKLQDWNSVVNAGLGGKVLQTALENTARASGVAIDSIIKKAGGFRNSLQQGWLTSQILTKTLSQFTGDLSVAQIKAMGYTEAQAEAIYKQSIVAVDAATKIKTLSQLTQALKEEVATAYGAIFKTIFGNINDATTLFTAVHNAAENALTKPIYDLNALLQGWDLLGGRKVLISALSEVFKTLGTVLKVVEAAFRSVFPPTTSEDLLKLTEAFKTLVDGFKIGANTANNLKRTFAGVFSIFSIAIFIIKQLAGAIGSMLVYMGAAPGDFLALTARAGDLIVKFKNLVESSDGIKKVFGYLGDVLPITIQLLQIAAQWVGSFFTKIEGKNPGKVFDKINISVGPLGVLLKFINLLWAEFSHHLDQIEQFIQPLMTKFDTFFKNMASSIAKAVGSLNFQDVVSLINTGLFAAVTLLLKKFVDHFRSSGGGLSGIVDSIKETMETLNETFETMQKTLKAASLLAIALAIGVLTISVVALSRVDTGGLIRAGSAITVMFTELMGSLVIFEKFIEGEGWAKMPIMMASLILLAAAVDVISIAVAKMAGLSWNDLAKGLTGLTVVLGELLVMLKLMGDPKGLIASGIGLTAFAKGVNVLATAVTTLGGLSWEQLAKGLTGVAVLLTSLGLFEKFAETNATGIASGLGIILLATAMKILASAMQTFGQFSWEQIGKGLTGVGGGLALIGTALTLIPPSSVISAAGVLLVAASLGMIADAIGKMGSMNWGTIGRGLTELAGALTLISAALFVLPPSTLLSAAAIFIVATSLGMVADALAKMGGMSWDAIAKSLVELAGALAIIATAMIFMEVALPGAAALLVVAAALLVLLPVLTTMGNMPWASLGEALAGLAGVFVILGAAGLLLSPLTPILVGLGAAIALIGLGVALAGAGVFLFATGLTALAAAGTVATAALTGIVVALLGLLPQVGKEIGLAVIAFATTIATAGPAIVTAIVTVLDALMAAITKESPKINTLLGNLLVMFLNDIVKYSPQINAVFMKLLGMLLDDIVGFVPKMVTAGANILVAVLNGIANNLGRVVTAATNVVIAFINAISNNGVRIANAGVQAVINLINGIADSIQSHTAELDQAGLHLATAIIDGLTGGLLGGASAVGEAAKTMAEAALTAAKAALNSHSPSKKFEEIGGDGAQGFVNGLVSLNGAVEDASSSVGNTALAAMAKTITGMSDLINSNVDVNPRITPVLDLSDVKKNASQISGLLTATPVTVGTSTVSAKIASAGLSANEDAITAVANTPKPPTPMSFTQNNYSPKALSAVEIYRQSKNLMSDVRGVLVYETGGDQQSG